MLFPYLYEARFPKRLLWAGSTWWTKAAALSNQACDPVWGDWTSGPLGTELETGAGRPGSEGRERDPRALGLVGTTLAETGASRRGPPAARGSSTGSCPPRRHPAAAQPQGRSGHRAAPSRRTQQSWGKTRTKMTTLQRTPNRTRTLPLP